MADWKSFQIEVPGKDFLEPIRQVLETLLVFLEILKTVLNTVKTFLVDFGNPIKALVVSLIKLIEELFLALRATGVFAYFDIPDPTVDPNFDRFYGGFQAFTERFKGSLYDTKDFNRPQPRTSTTSGFVLMVVDAPDIMSLIMRVKQLLRFFGKSFTSPRYEAPANFKVIPVGAAGDPIFAVASVFADGPIEAVQLQWTLPSSAETPDPGFSDVVGQTAAEFVPPNFVIEKSVDVNPSSVKIDISELGSDSATGIVEYDQPVNVDTKLASRFAKRDGAQVLARAILRDDAGEPVIKFQQYIKVGVGLNVLGQLGRFRYIDTDVQKDKTYYYRVRPYSGSLDINEGGKLNNMPTSSAQLAAGIEANSQQRFFKWPSASSDDEVVMGKPTGIIRTTLPPDVGDFDVVENLRCLFQTCFSLDFHLPLPTTTPGGNPPEFDSQGAPTGDTPANFVGKGSLVNQAGQLAAFEGQLVLELIAGLDSPGQAFEGDGLQTVTMPWQRFNVRRQSARIADGIASALLQAGGTSVQTFRDFMRGPLPRGPIDTQVGNLKNKGTLEKIVFGFTTPVDEEENDPVVLTTFQTAFEDAPLRQNLLVVVQFLKSFTLGGAPVDWISIAPLRDIIPWAGQFLYDILDKIQALVDAYKGFLDEILAFIELIERKINALEKFIQFLIDILNFIEGLQFGVYLLSVNGISGDASAWVSEIDNAGGDIPPSGTNGYSAGIGLAYVAADPGPFIAAFSLIFGA